MLKLDMSKAFDSVWGACLLEVLQRRGFVPRWMSRLSLLLSAASTHMLITGSADEPFGMLEVSGMGSHPRAFHRRHGCDVGNVFHWGVRGFVSSSHTIGH